MARIAKYSVVIAAFFCIVITTFAQEEHWMPDVNLRQAVRGALELPTDEPLTKEKILSLTLLRANDKGIVDITGLEYAEHLTILHLGGRNRITDLRPLTNLTSLVSLHIWRIGTADGILSVTNLDISPLANLINLERLSLSGNGITDISSLAGLKKLRDLSLRHNYIVDFSPLAGLTSLEVLRISNNWGTDFTPLTSLNLTTFEYDEVCDVAPIGTSVTSRIESRTLPSIVGWWLEPEDEVSARYDFNYAPPFPFRWDTTSTAPTFGLATQFAGDIEQAKEDVQQFREQNPNMLIFGDMNLHLHTPGQFGALSPDSDFWLRDSEGIILKNANGAYMMNILNTELQDLLIERVAAFAKCGVYDGIAIDGFGNHGIGDSGGGRRPLTPELADDEAIIAAHIRILSGIRERVQDGFLIVVNAARSKPIRYAEYVNGSLMESGEDYIGHVGGTYKLLQELDETLLWNEDNLRAPQLNWSGGFLLPDQPPYSPDNQRRVRLFTTRGLTLADNAYITVHYQEGPERFWYDFWEVDIGKPIGKKGQLCDGCEGLFIREFTKGWAVYNRSGKEQTIQLPTQATGVASGITSATHIISDLDGEMYLKQEPSTNSVGTVQVLDLTIGDPQEAGSEWMPDPALRAAIIEQLGLPANIPLTKDKMPRLTQRLIAVNKGIIDITGLEFATNLKALNLNKNHITDLRPLANLTNLVTLYLSNVSKQGTDSAISLDIRPLSGLINLEELSLEKNGISDISPLANMKKLRFLALRHNHIVDFSPLSKLTNLHTLWINNNPGTDFSPLAALNLTDFRSDADVNGDGVVNILDLVVVANAFGKAEPDLNGDGVVNIQDLVIVANAF